MLHLYRKITKCALLSAFSLFILSSSVSANPNFTFCQESPGNYTPDTPFGINLRQVLNTLTLQTPKNRGFYNTSVSNNSNNSVYARALCRGDVSSKTCKNCVQDAGGEIMNGCHTEKAITWSELCQIEHSYSTLSVVYTGKYPLSNAQEKNVTDPEPFKAALWNFMTNLSRKGAYDKTMFATGKIKVSGGEKIYGLVQCTRDVSATDCLVCLRKALGDLDACCGYKQGGTIFSRNCNLRFQLYQFYRDSSSNWKSWILLAVGLVCGTVILLASLIGFYIIRYRKSRTTPRVEEERGENALLHEVVSPTSVALTQKGDLLSSGELPFMQLKTINAATDCFSDTNKLGQGGFGTVHKGVLPDGKEVAVKRLSRKSWQGLEEFKNEVMLIAKLQHRNLVRLVGYGIEGEEKLLVYEYMPNRSLDVFIFDSDKRKELSWDIRINIIHGIARGLLYLHEDSRLKIIHRDLKPSNVLLDHEMVAKISDFGMARIFGENQNAAKTKRIVGTYGYMAPEYAMQGQFSVKSDVFSFGVILLEIISGRRNGGFYLTEQARSLLAYAWKLWNEGRDLEFLDPLLTGSCSPSEVVRCIHLGLLCVQEDPADRLDMSSVVVLLGSELISLPEPRQPAFSVGRLAHKELLPSSGTDDPSLNQVTVSSVLPR